MPTSEFKSDLEEVTHSIGHEVDEYNERSRIRQREYIAQKVLGCIIYVLGLVVFLVSLFSLTAFLPLAIVGLILFICGACLYHKGKIGLRNLGNLGVETFVKDLNSKHELPLRKFELLQKRNEKQLSDLAYLDLAIPQQKRETTQMTTTHHCRNSSPTPTIC